MPVNIGSGASRVVCDYSGHSGHDWLFPLKPSADLVLYETIANFLWRFALLILTGCQSES